MRRVLVACALLAACGSQPKLHSHVEYELPAVVDPLAPPLTMGPFEPSATAYNAGTAVPAADELASALFERLRSSLHEDSVHDPRIDAAARALSKLEGDAVITRTATTFALYEQGVPEPLIGIATAHGDDVAAIAEVLASRLDPLRGYGPAAVGIGRAAGHGVVVVLTRAPMFRLQPIARHLTRGHSVDLAGTLEPGLRAPTLTVTYSKEPTQRVALAPLGTGYALRFTCMRAPGPRWLTITALDGADVEQRLVSAQIDCDDELARVYRTEPAINLRGRDSSRILAALVNRERVAAGLPALRGELRANVAAGRRIVEHSDAETALREAALVPLQQGSVAFHVDSIEEAAELLLDDPALHAMLLRHDVSHIGVATAADPGGGLSVALQLVEISPVIDRRELMTRVWNSLEKVRYKSLDLIASWYASQLALGWDPSALDDEMHWKLSEARLEAVQLEVRTVDHLEDFDPAALVRGHHQRYAGVSVVQTARNGALVGRTIVVVLFGNTPKPRRR